MFLKLQCVNSLPVVVSDCKINDDTSCFPEYKVTSGKIIFVAFAKRNDNPKETPNA
jgi:hypothetical protein